VTLDDLLSRLEGVHRSGSKATALCPAHEDTASSFSASEGRDGRILLKCFAGCTVEQIVAALGLQMSDLMGANGRRRARATVPERVWTIRDAQGRAIAEHHRIDLRAGKKIWWTRNGAKGLSRLPLSDLPIYGTELVKDVPPGAEIYVVEGEKAADALREKGVLALGTVTGAQGTPGPTPLSVLRGRDVILWPDFDDAGREHMRRISAALASVAARVCFLSWGERPGDDAADYFARGGTVEGLASLISAKKKSAAEEVKPADLLDAIAAFIRRFVVLSREQVDAIALWVLHTWVIDAADATLFLAITSAEWRSGKTRLLEVLELLVRRPWRAITPSEAVLFRKVSAQEPTLLLDETDAIFSPKAKDNEGLRALLNAGNRRGATVDRCVPGGKGEVRLETFSVFCPRALAGIGRLPATVSDRSLPIRLKRRRRSEPVERFRFRDVEEEAKALRGQIEAWAIVSVEALRQAERPPVPDTLDDRQADGAEPLLAIADLAGGIWSERARGALVELCTGEGMSDDSLSVRLLRDVRTIFEARGVDRLHSADLCDALAEMEEAPWGDYKGKPIKPRALAWLLELFEVRSSQVKIDGRNRHGYTRDAFSDAWSRYVVAPTPSISSSEKLPTLPPASGAAFPTISETLPPPAGSVLKNGESPITTGMVAEVAFETPPGEPVHENGDDEAALL
jgi:hypothetical protein